MKEYNQADQLAQMKHQYEENLHFQISAISHEIRNPVTLIHVYLQMLAGTHPELTLDPYWSHITANMDYLTELLNSISQYNNSHRIFKNTVYFHQFLLGLADELSPILTENQITLTIEKKSALPPVEVDEIKIRQVLLNLIRNSIEALQENGHIWISIYFQDLYFILEIRDDGPGIPKEYLADLFEPFVTHKKEGTGLGLAIAKNIILAHDGTIDVASDDGNGTCFTIRLPL